MIRLLSNLETKLMMLLLLTASSGCASKSAVPREARLVTERSAGLGFEAPEAGTVYLTRKSNGNLIYSNEMHPGDRLIFHPAARRIILNGNVVKEDPSFDPKQIHRLYFLKG